MGSEWNYRPAADLDQPLADQHKSIRREGGLVSTMLHVAWRGAARFYFAVGHRLQVSGLEHLPPEPPAVIVANHASHLDAPLLCAVLPLAWRDRVFPIAAGDTFFSSPRRAALAALFLNALPMWRRRRSPRQDLGILRERLVAERLAYVLFPEGTRSRTGALGRFKGGLGAVVAGTSVPVVPAYIAGAHAAFPPDRRLPRFERISLRFGPALRFDETEPGREGWEAVRSRVESAVRALGATEPA